MIEEREADEAVLVIYAHNRPGVLAKIAAAFYRRGMNILALRACPTGEPEQSKIVVRVLASRSEIDRLALGLRNLIDVLSVERPEIWLPTHRD